MVSPVLNILKSPFAPLIKLLAFPKLKVDELIVTLLPSNLIPSPIDLPT